MIKETRTIYHGLGPAIRAARAKRRVTQATVARRLGIAQSTLSQWETGVVPIPDERLAQIAFVLDLRVSDFIGGDPRGVEP